MRIVKAPRTPKEKAMSQHPSHKRYVTILAGALLMLVISIATPVHAQDAPAPSADTETPAAQTHDSAHAEQVMRSWEAKHAATGVFTPPELQVAQRSSFGASAGDAEAVDIEQSEVASNLLAHILLTVTIAMLLVTLVVAWRLAHSRNDDGSVRRGFTLGSKLSLGFGSITVLLLLVSYVFIDAQIKNAHKENEVAAITANAALLQEYQQDMMVVRLNVLDFLVKNRNVSLEKYSDYAASMEAKLKACDEEITEPARRELLAQITPLFEEYDQRLHEAVALIDERNAIVDTQLSPAGWKAVSALNATIETADASGDRATALAAQAPLAHLLTTRLQTVKYIRSSNEDEATSAIHELQLGQRKISELIDSIDNPTHIAWLTEARDALRFYEQRLGRVVETVQDNDDVVDHHLYRLGPEIASLTNEIIDSIKSDEHRLSAEMDEAVASARTKGIAVSLIAVIVAVGVALTLVSSIRKALANMSERLKDIAQGEGDLTQRVDEARKDELGEVGKWFNAFVAKIENIISDISIGAEQIDAGSGQVSASSQSLSEGASEQAASLQQIGASLEEISSMVESERRERPAGRHPRGRFPVLGRQGPAGDDPDVHRHGRDQGLQRGDRKDHQGHRRDRLPDQPPRPQRRRRGRPRRRGRQGIRRGGRGSPRLGPALR
jgi:hypothetical protein